VTNTLTSDDILDSQSEALETDKLEDALPEEAGETLDGLQVTDSLDFESGLEKLYKGIESNIGGILTGGLKNAAVILMIAIFTSTVNAAFEGGAKYAILAGVMGIAAVSVFNISTFIGLGSKTLDDMNTFSKMMLPTLTAAAAAGGAVTSAAAKYAATTLFMDVLMTISKNVVVPLIYAYTATSIAEAAFGGDGLTGASNLLKWMTKTLMTVMMLVFVAYLTLTGVISGATDAVTAKALKTTISTSCPLWAASFRRGRYGAGRGQHPEKRRRHLRTSGGGGDVHRSVFAPWRELSAVQGGIRARGRRRGFPDRQACGRRRDGLWDDARPCRRECPDAVYIDYIRHQVCRYIVG
jgi:hypothetical protein